MGCSVNWSYFLKIRQNQILTIICILGSVVLLPSIVHCELINSFSVIEADEDHFAGQSPSLRSSTLSPAVGLENDNNFLIKANNISVSGLVKDVDQNFDGNDAGTDRRVRFHQSFSDVQSVLPAANRTMNESSPMAAAVVTSTRGNSWGQDLNEAPPIDKMNDTRTWIEFSASSDSISPEGPVVPELAAMGLTVLGGIWVLVQNRTRRKRAESV